MIKIANLHGLGINSVTPVGNAAQEVNVADKAKEQPAAEIIPAKAPVSMLEETRANYVAPAQEGQKKVAAGDGQETYSEYLARLQRIAQNIKKKQPWYKKLGLGLNQDDIESDYPEAFANQTLADAIALTINDEILKRPGGEEYYDKWDFGLTAKGRPGLKIRVDDPITPETRKVVKALDPSLRAEKPFRAYFDANYKLLNDPMDLKKLTKASLDKALLMVNWDGKNVYEREDLGPYKGDID